MRLTFVWRGTASRGPGSAAAVELSQEELAARASLHRNYVGPLERGERMPSILVAQQLATALGTTMAQLLAEVEEEKA